MAEATTITPPSPGKLPGITVSDAFGLPADWTLAASLNGEKAKGVEKLEVQPEKPDGTPDPDEMEKQNEAERVAAEKKTGEETAEADRIAAETAATEKKDKAAAEAAAKAKTTPAAKTVVKPVTTEKPGAAPAATPAPEAKKISIGGKEYTEDELKKKLEATQTPPPPKAIEPKKEPTAEEKAAEDAKTAKIESEWIASASQALQPSAVDEATMEKILTGGKDAVAAFDQVRREDMARTLLAARKDIGQIFKPFFDSVNRMEQGHMASEDERMWGEFSTAHPELAGHRNVVEQHAAALVEADPTAVAQMTEKDFNAKVAELTIGYIRQFNAEFVKAPAATPNGDPSAVSAAAKTLASAKATPAKPKSPPPPAGSLPVGSPSAGSGAGGNKDFQKSAVASLM